MAFFIKKHRFLHFLEDFKFALKFLRKAAQKVINIVINIFKKLFTPFLRVSRGHF
jgi:hypothetical protein